MDPFSVAQLGALLEVLWGTIAFIQDETGSGLCVARNWERAHGKALNIYPWQPHTRGHQALRTFRSKDKTGIQGGYEDVWQRLVMNRVELRREGRTHINDSNKHPSQTYTRGRQKPRRFRSSHKNRNTSKVTHGTNSTPDIPQVAVMKGARSGFLCPCSASFVAATLEYWNIYTSRTQRAR